MTDRVRPYLFYGATQALCAVCLRRVEAKEIIEDACVYLDKLCPEHGRQRVLIADDVAYWRMGRERFLKPPEQVVAPNTTHRYGCPYDCGICPEHEQHGCLCVLEITDHCNLRCPTCYASSSPERTTHRSLEQIERMLDRIVANEVEPDIVQVSGGEPTTHPQFFEVLDACRRRPLRHLMLNTNGIRIAKEPGFAERLASYGPGFEVYLQFDGFARSSHMTLRAADLRGLSTTLVATVRRGVNDDELGDIIRFAVKQRCVRGVTFQPVQDAGRNDGFDPAVHRLTLTETRRRILEQCDMFRPEDLIPVPCHPDSLAMAYALKLEGQFVPLTRFVDPELLIQGSRNTMVYEGDPQLRQQLFETFSTAHSPSSAADAVGRLLCCLPQVKGATPWSYEYVFRIIILQFLDRHSLDMRSVRKSCVHIAHPDGQRLIPFDTFNILYRDALEREVLLPLRRKAGSPR